jgi:glycosyltransferase involved in cell wall biosynthesis
VVYRGCTNRFREPVTDTKVEETKARYRLPERYLLAVGAIEPRKNLRRLIEAMHLAKTDLPLVAVGGKNAYADRLANEAQALGVDLRYLHDLPFSELPAVYKGAELLCYPSIFEGFGIPILEAMCVGTPVLTSTGSCFSETGGDAALYADPLNPSEIATQLTKILSEPALREEMIQKGKIQADRFTDEKVAANLIRVAGIG